MLIIAGIHGVEPQSSFLLTKLVPCFALTQTDETVFSVFQNQNLVFVPDVNVYGLKNFTRTNQNKVDLNRNFPAANWSSEYDHADCYPGPSVASERETQALVEIIQNKKPSLMISIHTNHYVDSDIPPQLNFDGQPNSQGYFQAQQLAELLALPFTTDIGYPTPGSLGSYCLDLKIPCITLELDDKLDNEQTWEHYGPALKSFIEDLG